MARRALAILPLLLGAAGALHAQSRDLAASSPSSSTPVPPPFPAGAADSSSADEVAIHRTDARTITLEIPAPRGLILDRNGVPFAQNRVVWQLSLQYEQFENADRDFVIRWARERIEKAKQILKKGGVAEFSDDQLWDHYRDRRWLPLYLSSSHIGPEEKKKMEAQLPKGLTLSPVYQRYYPEGDLAAHIIGYTHSAAKLPTGPINLYDPLWERTEGQAGLEKLYDAKLQGEPGVKRMLFDEHGHKELEEQVKRPRPGGALVTTLNLEWQKAAEKALRAHAKRGAFVLIDVVTGEVLVLASLPSYDLNQWVPGISQKDYEALQHDPNIPFYPRAFGYPGYPPGSTWKPMVALTGLNNGTITEDSEINCPASITLGEHTFHNHNNKPAGDLDVRRALALSNNIFFYQLGQRIGPPAFFETARHFGYGEKTGLPLIGETAGNLPEHGSMPVRKGAKPFTDADAFNLAIGQGAIEVSPLQVAQGMAGIANGGLLPKLHLISQIQDVYGGVIDQAVPERRNNLEIDSKSIAVVRKGMHDVVNSEYGTGRSAALSYTELCGKTGTAQWNNDRRVAWFAGFLPYDDPRFAFAVLYEGKPGERPSGGKNAAPIVKEFFESLKGEFKDILAPPLKAQAVSDEDRPPKAEAVDEDDDSAGDDSTMPPTLSLDPDAPAPAAAPPGARRKPAPAPQDRKPPKAVEIPEKPKPGPAKPAPAPVEGDGDEDGEDD